jgi:hypothetical protein
MWPICEVHNHKDPPREIHNSECFFCEVRTLGGLLCEVRKMIRDQSCKSANLLFLMRTWRGQIEHYANLKDNLRSSQIVQADLRTCVLQEGGNLVRNSQRTRGCFCEPCELVGVLCELGEIKGILCNLKTLRFLAKFARIKGPKV